MIRMSMAVIVSRKSQGIEKAAFYGSLFKSEPII